MKRFLRGVRVESIRVGWGVGLALAFCAGCSGPRQFGRSSMTPAPSAIGANRNATPRASANLREIRPAPPALPPIYPDEIQEGAPWAGLHLAMQPSEQGVLVGLVSMGSPAELAGIQPGDFIFQLDGQMVQDAQEVLSTIERVGVGGSLRLGVHRAQRVRLFRVAPVAKPAPVHAEVTPPALPSATLEGAAPSAN
jgi:hypothetical protein